MPAASIGNIHIGLYVDVGDQRRFTDVANLVERDSRRMNSSLGSTTRSVSLLRNQMSQNMRLKLGAESLRTLSRATDDINKMRAALMGVAAISGTGLTGALGAGYLLQTADKARLLSNQLKTVTSSTIELNTVQDKLFEISQRTRSSFEATTTIYARTARATETLGISQEKLLRITETVQKAFSIGGASTQEAQGAAIQLSQGIASNRFGGEEFRSVAENAPVLLRGIAESLDVDIGKLREMSMEGKLTASVLVDAIAKASGRIDKEFGMTTATVGQSITMLDNAFLQYIGDTDKSYGATKTLANGIQGLADNFEEVMWWITRVSAGLAGMYAARAISQKGQSVVGGVKANNAAIRQEMADIVEQNKALDARRADIAKEIEEARRNVDVFESKTRGDAADRAHKAREREFSAQQKLADLDKQRQDLGVRMAAAQAAGVSKLRGEVEVGRQLVKDNLKRVEQAREAAAAEERNLRARQAQALLRADNVVREKVNGVASANSKVQRSQMTLDRERVKAEYAAQVKFDEARAKKGEEIEKRRRQLISNTIRLQGTQSKLSDLRSVQGTEGFDKTFGAEYRSLLKDQQAVMASTSKVRKEIVGLQSELEAMPQQAGSSRALTSAMAQHEKAVMAARAAVDDLAKAEARRTTIASSDVSGKTLATRLAQEQKEIARYERSVGNLVNRMISLDQATKGAFSGAQADKFGKEFDTINKKIVSAQSNLKAASAALSEAQNGGAERASAALKVQAQSMAQVNALQDEATALVRKTEQNVNKLAAAQKRLNLLRRAGSNVLDFFGGWTGVAMTAGLMAVAGAATYFAGEAQKSTERTTRLKEELNSLGLLSDEAAGRIDKTSKSLAQMSSEEVRNSIRELNEEIKRMKSPTGFMESVFGGGGDTLADIQAELAKIQKDRQGGGPRGGVKRNSSDLSAAKELSEIARLAAEGKTPTNELIARLDTISKLDLSKPVDDMITKLRSAIPFVEAAVKRIAELQEKSVPNPNDIQGYSRTTAAKAQAQRDKVINQVTDEQLSDASLTEKEQRIDAIMEEMIKKADKVGQTLFKDADLKTRATSIYDQERTIKNSDAAVGGFVDSVVKAESGGNANAKNPNSSATGLGQFIESTWLSLFKKHFPDEAIGKTDSQILMMRRNADKSKEMIEIYARENKDVLEKAGVSVDQVALQLAHFLGPQGAAKVLKAAPGTPVSEVLGQDAIKANPTILGAGKTVDDVIAYGEKRAGMTTAGTQRLDTLEKWVEELTDLDLQSKVKGMEEFDQQVLQQAQSMGVTTKEMEAYMAAVNSGNMDAIPEKFKKIREAMQLGLDNEFTTKINELGQSRAIEFLSALDQKVIETAKSFGIGKAEIDAYIQAVSDGRLSAVPDSMARIRDEMQKTADNTQLIDFANGAADAFGGLVTDLFHGEDALKNFGLKMMDLVLQILVIEPLVNSLKTAFSNLGSGLSGIGGGGGLFGSLFSAFSGAGASALPGKAGGGYTGYGAKYEEKGIVHGGEFVFDKESTTAAGPAKLYALMEFLKSGKGDFGLAGMSSGGLVPGNVSMPGLGALGGSMHASDGMSQPVRESQGIEVRFAADVDQSGNLTPFVTSVARGESNKAATSMAKTIHKGLPEQVQNINRNPRKRP